MPNDKITAVGANIAEKAAMIWNVADMHINAFPNSLSINYITKSLAGVLLETSSKITL